MKKSSISFSVILSLVCLLFFGCSQKSSLKDLELKDGLYYIKGTSTPYSGKLLSTYSSGKDSVIGLLKDGKFDGIIISYYENGTIKDSISYKMGERITSKSYTEEGSPVCDCNEIYFNDSKGVWMTSSSEKVFNGTCISYWDNKNKKSSKVIKSGKERESYEWYENGNIHQSIIYNENGNLKSNLLGYENGQEQQKGTFENGVLVTLEIWYKNGNKCINHQFVGDKIKSLDGWYENGKVVYHFESRTEKPMESGPSFKEFKDLLTTVGDLIYISNGKGKSYHENGDWMTELFYEGEKQVMCKYRDSESNEEGSVRYITRFKEPGLFGEKIISYYPYIDYIGLYTDDGGSWKNHIHLSREKTTIEECLNNLYIDGNGTEEYFRGDNNRQPQITINLKK